MANTFLTNKITRPLPSKIILDPSVIAKDKSGNGINLAAWITDQIRKGSVDTSVSSDIREINYGLQIGETAGAALTSGARNVLIGPKAGSALTTGFGSTFLGERVGYNATGGSENTLIGYLAGYSGNFVGSAANVAIGVQAGNALSGGDNNVLIGSISGFSLTTGSDNVFIGDGAGQFAVTSSQTIGIGNGAAAYCTPAGVSFNIAIGSLALYHTTTGLRNIAIGDKVARNGIVGSNNIVLGNNAGYGYEDTFGIDGDSNIIIGDNAGLNRLTSTFDRNIVMGQNAVGYYYSTNATGVDNIILGTHAAYYLGGNASNTIAIGNKAGYKLTTGDENIFIGHNSGINCTTAGGNVCIGFQTGYYLNTTGNVIIGNSAGPEITSGIGNTIIGAFAGRDNYTGGYNVVIGYRAADGIGNSVNNQLWISNSNTTTPLIFGDFSTARLKVNGTFEVSNVAEGGTAAIVTTTKRELHTLTLGATSDTTTISIPIGSELLGCSMNVNTAVTTSAATNTWEAAFITGSTTAIAIAGTVGTLDTKVDTLFASELTTATTEIQFDAAGAETFTAGVIEIVVYYKTLTSLANV